MTSSDDKSLSIIGISDYSEGQFSGSINTLLRNKSIKKTDRGIYVINQNKGGISLMKTCFVVSPIGDVGSCIICNISVPNHKKSYLKSNLYTII